MQRRQVLKGLIGAGTVAGTGAAATIFATRGASASSTFTIDGTSVETDSGDVDYVNVTANLITSWDGFDRPVTKIRYIDKVKVGGNWYKINDVVSDPLDEWSSKGNGGDGWGGPGEWVYYTRNEGREGKVHVNIDWDIIDEDNPKGFPEDPAPTSPLDVDKDGATKDRKIVFAKQVQLRAADGTVLGGPNTSPDPSVRDDFTVTVSNQAATSSSSGDGDSSAG